AAYNFAGVTVSGVPATGAGQKIGLVEFDTANNSDVSLWLSSVGLSSTLINQVQHVSVLTPPSSPGAGATEVLLDIDTVLGAAPGATVVSYETCGVTGC